MEPKPLEKNDICSYETPEHTKYVHLSKVKAACEWYLFYVNDPERLMDELPEIHKEFEKIGKFVRGQSLIDLYNDWLFRRAFAGVLE